VRIVVIAAVAWTVLAIGFVLFVPSGHVTMPCMHLVGRSAACEADQATVNAAYQTYQTLPSLISIAAGYVAIAAVRIKASRGSTPRR
jgi:hypothetical protein